MAVDRYFMFPETRASLIAISEHHRIEQRKNRIANELRRVLFKAPVYDLNPGNGHRCTCSERKRECDCSVPRIDAGMAKVLDLAHERAERRKFTGAPITMPGAL